MEVRVLGSGAGGGVPQWNCSCANCARSRREEAGITPRTQSSIAVRDGEQWVLVNASPDIRQQLNALPEFHDPEGPRSVRLAGVVLVDSQIDHTAGLLLMRESATPLHLYCTRRVHDDLSTGFPVIRVLEHYCGIEWFPIPTDGSFFHVAAAPGLSFTAISLSSKAPPYSPHRDVPAAGDNIGLLIEDDRRERRLFYAPGVGRFEEHLAPVMASAHCLLVDGTAWHDDELARRGVGSRRAAEMGHLAQAGAGGMIERLRPFDARKILIHINNTNPILDGASDERIALAGEGIEVAYDGMQFSL